MKSKHPGRIPEYLQHILQIIGEAANKVRTADPEFAAQHPQVPWALMYGMRNRVIHDYFEVDLAVVWQTVQQDLPELRNQMQALLKIIQRGQ